MVRTTRKSAGVKNSTSSSSSGDSDNSKGEASPPGDVEIVSATGDVGETDVATGGNVEEPLLSPNLRASVVLEKLEMGLVEPGPSPGSGTARKVARGRRKSGQPRATRSQQRAQPTSAAEDKEDSNDDGLVELIEIVDDDSKSHESGSNIAPSEVSESTSMAVDDESVEAKDTKMEVDKESDEQTVQVDKKSDEDEASSSGSGSGALVHVETESESGSKPELVGTRKSKRQVKVTNKYRDFVVDAPLPSSQVPYADVKLARSNGGGRKSHPPKEPEVVSSCDDLSTVSAPMMRHPPLRTYGSKKKSSDEDTPKRRSTRACTPVPRDSRFRRKKTKSTSEEGTSTDWAIDSITLSPSEDPNDSTLAFNIDSSYFTDDELYGFDSPSPEEFCGWPEEEFNNPEAGPSCSSLSSMMSFRTIPVVQPSEEDTSGIEDKPEVEVVTKKRRGRPGKAMAPPQPVVPLEEEPLRPAGSMFIKRSYKTTRSTVAASVPSIDLSPEVKPVESVTPRIPVEEPMETTTDLTVESEDVLEDTIEIVLQADEIINDVQEVSELVIPVAPKPFRRRRIRGGSRPTPADGLPRRGRSRRDTAPTVDEEETVEVTKPMEEDEEPKEQTVPVPGADEVTEDMVTLVMEVDDVAKPVEGEEAAPMVAEPSVVDETDAPKAIEIESGKLTPLPTLNKEPEKTSKKTPAKDSRRKSTAERRKSTASPRTTKVQFTELAVKEPEPCKEKVEAVTEVKVEAPAQEPKVAATVEPEKAQVKEEARTKPREEPPSEERKPPQAEAATKTSKDHKKSSKDDRESRKDSRKSKNREREQSSRDRRDREPSRSRSSASSKDRDKEKDRKRSSDKKDRRSELEKKPDGEKKRVSEVAEKKPDAEKKRVQEAVEKKRVPEVAEKKPEAEKKRVQEVVEKKPEVERKRVPDVAEKKPDVEKKRVLEVVEKKPEVERKRVPEVAEKKPEAEKKRVQEVVEKKPDVEKKRVPEVAEKKPEAEKKRVQEVVEKKPDVEKKRVPEVAEKKPDAEKKRVLEVAEKKPVEPEKKEVVTKPPTPVPKPLDKPKKCFDSELQALDSTSKQKPSEECKRTTKDPEKPRKSDKHVKYRSDTEEKKKKSGSSDYKGKDSKEKSRSTDCSPVPSKVGASKKSFRESSSKRESSSSSRSRKSLKDEKPKEKEKENSKEKPVELPPHIDIKPVELDPPEPAEVSVKEEPEVAPVVKEELPPPEPPRIVTKASRKMYQNDEELQIPTSSQESLVAQSPLKVPKEEPTIQEAPPDVQEISDAFDASVQISGPRPEVALKEFQNISISDEKPIEEVLKVEEEPSVAETEPASPQLPALQESSNDDSNSNNSSTTEGGVKDAKLPESQDDANIRRSSRIKTISSQKQRTSGHGLVKDRDKLFKKTNISMGFDSKVLKDAITGNFSVVSAADVAAMELSAPNEQDANVTNIELSEEYLRDMEDKLSRFETIRDNLYHCDKVISKEAKKMTCDCFLTGEEIERGELGCGEDCLNKLLMIECGSRCIIGERCTNKRFQKLEYSNCQVFRTEKKGFGIQASTEIVPGDFIMEYVGEVLNSEQFDERAELYSKEKNKHYYFMALRSDAIIDATTKGNISRFINHSCDPNAETQKWTVNGELRIGFFCTKYIMPGEEITFDYQFQRYGRRAQKCYCEAENCTGWIGGDPGSDGESEYDDEEEVEESEEEEEEVKPEVPSVVPTAIETPVDEVVKIEEPTSLDVEAKPLVEGEPDVAKPIAVEPTVDKPPEPKPKKVRKRIERPKKRRPQIHEDPDLEQEINHLLKTGLKNQAQTLKLSRLMVRAKDIKSRSRLLTILQSGELPCRRLFLDYHGLQLLYGWICESTESIEDLKFSIQILDTLDRLPIPNKTMLKDSKILQTIEKWAKIEKSKEKEKEKEPEKEKESSSSSPSDSNGAGSDSNTSSDAKRQEVVRSAEVLKNMPELLKIADLGRLKEIISSASSEKEAAEKDKPSAAPVPEPTIPSAVSLIDCIKIPEPEDENAPEEKRLGTQIRILSCKLLISWINLKEVFRIPKKERIEQMKEHEREADLRYKALGLGDDDASSHRHSSSRFFDRSRELKRRKSVDDRELLNFHKMKRPLCTASPMPKMDNLSKQQRRQMFEMKVAHEEAERRNMELWKQHESNCLKFGLNPHHTNAMDVPVKMNPATGEYFAADDRPLPRPPSHMYLKVQPPPMPTNPEDYELPPMDLPPLWKFAIDERGRLYYFHVKDRVPQWEPPKKNAPTGPGQGLRDEDISMSSDSSTTDTEDSEQEYLDTQLEQLLKKKKKQQSSFNLDDVLAKPDDMNDDLSKTIKDLEAGDSSPHASSSGEKLIGSESFEKTAEEMLQHRKRKHSNRLVQEKVISPRTEEDKLYGQMEMKRYKETKEKLRRRKEEAKRLRARSMLDKSLSDSPFSGSYTGDALDRSATENSLIDDDLVVSHKIVDDKCIVDELDILTKKKKISPYEEWQKVKQRLGKKRAAKLGESSSTFGGSSTSVASSSSSLGSSKVGKRKKLDRLDLNSEEARKIKEKFRGEIAGVIVQHLGAYRKDSCQTGRITNTEDFKHLARKLTHFVLVKELKHCDNTINELEVTDSVRTKAREFIKKYMAKHGTIYVRGENEPDYANINL